VERKRFKYTSKISLFLWIHRIFGAETVVREIYCGILILVFADFHGGENIFYNDDNNSTFETLGMLKFIRLISRSYTL
jgi:hypothetical protein